jgi:hypothetical protein
VVGLVGVVAVVARSDGGRGDGGADAALVGAGDHELDLSILPTGAIDIAAVGGDHLVLVEARPSRAHDVALAVAVDAAAAQEISRRHPSSWFSGTSPDAIFTTGAVPGMLVARADDGLPGQREWLAVPLPAGVRGQIVVGTVDAGGAGAVAVRVRALAVPVHLDAAVNDALADAFGPSGIPRTFPAGEDPLVDAAFPPVALDTACPWLAVTDLVRVVGHSFAQQDESAVDCTFTSEAPADVGIVGIEVTPLSFETDPFDADHGGGYGRYHVVRAGDRAVVGVFGRTMSADAVFGDVVVSLNFLPRNPEGPGNHISKSVIRRLLLLAAPRATG